MIQPGKQVGSRSKLSTSSPPPKMGIIRRRYEESSSPSNPADFRHRANQISLPALISIVLAGTLIIAVGLAFFGLCLSRRGAERKEQGMRAETASMDSGDIPAIIRSE